MENSNDYLSELSKPLTVDQIDFRVQSINKGGYATILAYKDARVDMNRLDEVAGPMSWKREQEFKDGKLYCKVSIYSEYLKQWICKEDVGTPSKEDKDNNQVKGHASDAFKRACFNWGIGRELYDYPVIQIKLNQNEFKVNGKFVNQTYELKLKEWQWYSEFDGNKITFLYAKDQKGKGNVRFKWGTMKPKKGSAQ